MVGPLYPKPGGWAENQTSSPPMLGRSSYPVPADGPRYGSHRYLGCGTRARRMAIYCGPDILRIHLNDAAPALGQLIGGLNISPYYTSERTCIISRMIRASGPWAEGRYILDCDGWAGSVIIPDGDGLAQTGSAEVVGYYVDGCTKVDMYQIAGYIKGACYHIDRQTEWAEGAVKDLLYTGGPMVDIYCIDGSLKANIIQAYQMPNAKFQLPENQVKCTNIRALTIKSRQSTIESQLPSLETRVPKPEI
ncbi:hypothetical protein DFJ58DRAFT_848670 [Suillus subalutaceus]|uniref:uncharacterized protein n=1 Tax=Suillus subalutaceus TaxID=48586 RepID=UPI001B85C973|nr:uncharacterized protein DFJ58DRAFT_848670 [Suillus subalutaceus]KAG1829555.1 hypothetical protein DFJ58DRAFT_848670 [Suillus subalutaceus]